MKSRVFNNDNYQELFSIMGVKCTAIPSRAGCCAPRGRLERLVVRPHSWELPGWVHFPDSFASEEGYVFAWLACSRFPLPCPLITGIVFLCFFSRVLIVWARQSFRGAFVQGPGLEAIWHLCELGTAARTKPPTLGGVCSRCGGWKSEIKVLAGSVSPEASLLGSQTAAFFPCPHGVFPLPAYVPIPLLASPNGLGPARETSFQPNYLFKDRLPKGFHFGVLGMRT